MSATASHSSASTSYVTDEQRTFLRNRISWGAVFAGVAAALVIQLLLNILGVGIGMSSVTADNMGDNPSASGFSMTAGIWWTLSGIIASLVGGVVAGRLCGTSDNNTARWHGFVSWAAATLVLFYLLTSAVGGIIGGTFNALGSTLGGAGRAAATAVSGAASATDGDALAAQVRRLVNPNDAQSVQDNVVAYIRASTSGDQATANGARDRAVDSLARAANVSPDEARTRLGQAEQQYRQTVDQAKAAAQRAAEAGRKGVATAGILGFIALVLGGIAAWIGGGMGAPRPEVTGAFSRNV
jgi:hypothetical protein